MFLLEASIFFAAMGDYRVFVAEVVLLGTLVREFLPEPASAMLQSARRFATSSHDISPVATSGVFGAASFCWNRPCSLLPGRAALGGIFIGDPRPKGHVDEGRHRR